MGDRRELEDLFREAVRLFNEGDLEDALAFFQEYIRRTASLRLLHEPPTARDYVAAIRERLAGAVRPEAEPPPPPAGRGRATRLFAPPPPDLPGAGDRIWRRPHMDFSTPSPVKPGTSFRVRIRADQSEAEAGEESEIIEIPADAEEKVFRLDVRLLASAHFRIEGPEVQEFTIVRSEPKAGPAYYQVGVLPAAELVTLAGRPPALSAVFSYRGRPSGKVSRPIAIEGFTAEAARDLTELPGPRPRETIRAEGDAKRADLTVAIAAQAENDSRHFWCTVDGVTEEWNLPDATANIVNAYMQAFTAPNRSRIERLASLKGAGKQLFQASPRIFQDAFWKLIDSGERIESIAIVSEEPFIPWELMVPNRSLPDGLRQSRPALGVEFRVGRWTRRNLSSSRQKICLGDSYVVAPVYAGNRNLPHAQEEATFVAQCFAPGERIEPASFETLDEKFRAGRSLVHFACHGEVKDAGRQLLYLDNNRELSAFDICGLDGVEQGFSSRRPFVFLNACQVGRPVPGLVGVAGFAQAFIDLGASAVIAPLWSVKDDIAHEIAMTFYQTARDQPQTPFSEILKGLRAKAYDPAIAEDTYAAYCFYGDPLACRG